MAGVYKNGKWGLIDKKDRLVIPFMYHDVSQFANHKKEDNNQSDVKSYSPKFGKLQKILLGMGKAWAALFGEVFFLFMISKLLPKDKTNVYWMLVLITIIVSFILFYVIVSTVKGLSKEKMEM